jgi:hypothetical protein
MYDYIIFRDGRGNKSDRRLASNPCFSIKSAEKLPML